MIINRKLGHEILSIPVHLLSTNFYLHVSKICKIFENVLAANISHQKPDLKYFSTLALSQILVAANQIIPGKFQKYSSGK